MVWVVCEHMIGCKGSLTAPIKALAVHHVSFPPPPATNFARAGQDLTPRGRIVSSRFIELGATCERCYREGGTVPEASRQVQ